MSNIPTHYRLENCRVYQKIVPGGPYGIWDYIKCDRPTANPDAKTKMPSFIRRGVVSRMCMQQNDFELHHERWLEGPILRNITNQDTAVSIDFMVSSPIIELPINYCPWHDIEYQVDLPELKAIDKVLVNGVDIPESGVIQANFPYHFSVEHGPGYEMFVEFITVEGWSLTVGLYPEDNKSKFEGVLDNKHFLSSKTFFAIYAYRSPLERGDLPTARRTFIIEQPS